MSPTDPITWSSILQHPPWLLIGAGVGGIVFFVLMMFNAAE